MNTKRNKAIVLLLLVSVFLSSMSLNAFAAIPAGTVGGRLFRNYVAQARSEWCWAASAENAILWEMTPTRDQWDAVRFIKGSADDSFPNESGSIYESALAAEYISNYNEDYTAIESKKSYDFLCQEIYDSHPIINGAGYYGGTNNRQGGHATLIIGWSTASGNQEIIYFDSATSTVETCTYAQFCDGSFNTRKYDQTCYNTTN